MSDRRVRIRPALYEDLDEVRRLFRAYAAWLQAEVYLADFEAEPAACEMKRLWIAPEGRGMGLGKALLQACINGARARRCKRLHLETLSARMPEAEGLYRQAGFVETEPYADERRPEVPCLALPL